MLDQPGERVMEGLIHSIDRRLMLGMSASTLLGVPGMALAQQQAGKPGNPAGGKKLSQLIAEFIVGFDLNSVAPEVIDRARAGIVDTVGVMLAGCRQDVSRILCDM